MNNRIVVKVLVGARFRERRREATGYALILKEMQSSGCNAKSWITLALPLLTKEGNYPHSSRATSTASFSLAHCSSSVRILPSSVEAKPHCGDSAS